MFLLQNLCLLSYPDASYLQCKFRSNMDVAFAKLGHDLIENFWMLIGSATTSSAVSAKARR